jgi:hypothetical protein
MTWHQTMARLYGEYYDAKRRAANNGEVNTVTSKVEKLVQHAWKTRRVHRKTE